MAPLASTKVLPCSEDNSRASESYSFCASSRNLIITRARRCGLTAAQAGCAASATAIACSTSACLAKATLALPARCPLDLDAADEMSDLAHGLSPCNPYGL